MNETTRRGDSAGFAVTEFRLGHRPGLDVVRGVAVVLMVLAHARVPAFAGGGQSGLVLFFVLSGFLITRLIVEERASTGRIGFAAFYWRRAIRLLPALALLLAVLLSWGALAKPDAAAVMLYVGNLSRAWFGGDLGVVNHLWSLGVEEQFYLLWPLALLVTRRPTRWLVVLLAASWMLRLVGSDAVAQYDTIARSDAIAAGCLLGLHADRLLPVRRSLVVAGWVLLAVVSIGVFALRPGITLAALAATLAVAGGTTFGRLEPLGWLGRRSYAIYLWHFPALALIPTWWALVFTLGMTAVSWHFVEKPASRLRNRMPRRSERVEGAKALA